MRSFNPVPPNKKTLSIVICTGDNTDLPEGRGCLRTFFEKIYESMMRIDLLAVVFSGGEPPTMWFNTRCASGYVLTTRLSKPYAHQALRLWLYAHHAMSSGYAVQSDEPLAMCSPGANTTAIRSMKRHEEHISKAAASQISLLCILW